MGLFFYLFRMQPYRQVCFSIILILCTIGSQAQEFLVLEKMGTKKRHEYFSGDNIIFKLKDGNTFRTDEIIGLGEGKIFFETGPVPLIDIENVSLSNKKRAMKGTGTTLVIGGLGYMILDLFNKTISEGDVYVDSKVARTAGIIAGTGLVMVVLSKKKVSLKKNWRLRIVDI